MKLTVGEEVLELLSQKCVWIEKRRLLIIADAHLGKISHFRKSGVALPEKVNDKNTENLITLLQKLKPQRMLFLGDLFHSVYNNEWEVLGQVREAFSHCAFELVIGNHDILSEHQYEKHKIQLHPTHLEIGNLIFTHEPMEKVPKGKYNLSGHIHPGVHLEGIARQSMMLPCFYFGKNSGLLPAFGLFTGLARIRPKEGDKVFVIAEGKVLELGE